MKTVDGIKFSSFLQQELQEALEANDSINGMYVTDGISIPLLSA
ncbi:hypothetical protein [Bartonella clarridgeiae]|nr:hypothetical protein [Bartonella clarridgeiae]WCR55460.1 MAG: hypothetical protein PG977_000853 [Bartonella clarridgeiae]